MKEAPRVLHLDGTEIQSIQSSFILCSVCWVSVGRGLVVWCVGGLEEGLGWWGGAGRSRGSKEGVQKNHCWTFSCTFPLGSLGRVASKYVDKQRSLGGQLNQHLHKLSLSSMRPEMRGRGNIVQWFLGVGSRPLASTTWELVINANSQVPPQAYLIWNLRVRPNNLCFNKS